MRSLVHSLVWFDANPTATDGNETSHAGELATVQHEYIGVCRVQWGDYCSFTVYEFMFNVVPSGFTYTGLVHAWVTQFQRSDHAF